MKRRFGLPVDLMLVVIIPALAVTAIGLVATCAMTFYNWLMARH